MLFYGGTPPILQMLCLATLPKLSSNTAEPRENDYIHLSSTHGCDLQAERLNDCDVRMIANAA
jgi:hypothetical protein